MKSLADRLLDILPEFPLGPTMQEAAQRLSTSGVYIRKAFDKLDSSGRAVVVRRIGGRTLYLVPLGYPILACKNCHVEFERQKKSKRVCCSRSCANSWTWRKPGQKEKRSAGIRASKATPEAKQWQAEHNQRRWSKPEEHEKLSEHNRRQWRDPVLRAKRSAGIQKSVGSPERRKFYRDLRNENWSDPDYSARMKAAQRYRKFYEYDGQMLCLVELSEATGIKRETLYYRLTERGMSVAEAVARSAI